MYSKIAVYLFFSCLCFVSSAQKHAVMKWKDCEVVIYNAYGNFGEQEEHNPLLKTIKNDTAFAKVVLIFGHEIQGKKLKLTSTIADSFTVEQSYLMNYVYYDEQGYRTNYLPYTYQSEWKTVPNDVKNKFKIISYVGNSEKFTPYKAKDLSLKAAKKYVIDAYKKKQADDRANKSYYEETIRVIKSAESLENLMRHSIDYIYLRITLFKEGKKVGEKFIVFEYGHGC